MFANSLAIIVATLDVYDIKFAISASYLSFLIIKSVATLTPLIVTDNTSLRKNADTTTE